MRAATQEQWGGDGVRLFGHRRHDVPPPAPRPQPARVVRRAPPPLPVPQPEPELSDQEVLTYLDSCMEGTAPRFRPQGPVDLMDRLFELTSNDWSEDEAGAELAWLADYDACRIRPICHRLLTGLLRNPFPDVAGVRASRVAFRALRQCEAAAES